MDLKGAIPDFETSTLAELLQHWSGLLWWLGVRPALQQMLKVDLTLSENIILRSLQRGPMTVAEAADCLLITHSAASRAVDRLVQDGLVRREENPEDRRQKTLTLTPAGESLVGDHERILLEGIGPLLATLGPEEQEQLRVLVAHMLSRYVEQHAPEGCGSWRGALQGVDESLREEHEASAHARSHRHRRPIGAVHV